MVQRPETLVSGHLGSPLRYGLETLGHGRAEADIGFHAAIRQPGQTGRAEGPAGFFRGLPAAVLQIVPYMGLFFATYETLRRTLATVGPLPFGGSDACAGTMASVVAKTAVFPLDLVRKRLQVQGPSRTKYVFRAGEGVPVYTGGVWGTVRDVVRREGLRGLYRGLGVGLVKAAPAGAVTMWVYEGVLGELTSVRGD